MFIEGAIPPVVQLYTHLYDNRHYLERKTSLFEVTNEHRNDVINNGNVDIICFAPPPPNCKLMLPLKPLKYRNARKKCENIIVRFEQNCSFAYRVRF